MDINEYHFGPTCPEVHESPVALISKNCCIQDRYEFAGDLQDQEHMCGLMEEHLNCHIEQPDVDLEQLQLDLLMPVKEKYTEKRKETPEEKQ